MSWVVVGHESEEYPTDGHAMVAAWKIADRAGELVRAEVKEVIPVVKRSAVVGGLRPMTSEEQERIAHAIEEKAAEVIDACIEDWQKRLIERAYARSTRQVWAGIVVSEGAFNEPGFTPDKVWAWLNERLYLEALVARARIFGELTRETFERPDQWSVEYRLTGQATRSGGWE